MKKILTIALIMINMICFAQVRIHVHLDSAIDRSITGKLFIYTSTDTIKGVPNSPDIANPQPMYSVPVNNWTKQSIITIDDHATAFSTPLSKLTPGVYKIAGVVDGNPEERGSFNPGSFYSTKEARLEINNNGQGETHLYLNREPIRGFKETESLKLVHLKSSLLSSFHKKDITLKAAVVLPKEYANDTSKKFPVVYIIPGWGGTHFDVQGSFARTRYGMDQGAPKIYVYLNPETQTPFGLHCFVDSRVNGPWGKALVEELIPYINKTYRSTGSPKNNFVVGQSSGGYAALWLPLNYPKAFGGGWAVSPDPVDFSNFTGVELYSKKANVYTDASGNEIPFFIIDGKPATTLKKFIALEIFEGDGGQFQSFEAEFGVPDKQGRPKQIFDRETGAIDPKIVKTWEPYDLGKFVSKNWKSLQADLNNRLHVYAGEKDNFFLNKAVEAFGEKAKKANAKIVVELIPNANHFSIWSPEFTARVQKEIDEMTLSNR